MRWQLENGETSIDWVMGKGHGRELVELCEEVTANKGIGRRKRLADSFRGTCTNLSPPSAVLASSSTGPAVGITAHSQPSAAGAASSTQPSAPAQTGTGSAAQGRPPPPSRVMQITSGGNSSAQGVPPSDSKREKVPSVAKALRASALAVREDNAHTARCAAKNREMSGARTRGLYSIAVV